MNGYYIPWTGSGAYSLYEVLPHLWVFELLTHFIDPETQSTLLSSTADKRWHGDLKHIFPISCLRAFPSAMGPPSTPCLKEPTMVHGGELSENFKQPSIVSEMLMSLTVQQTWRESSSLSRRKRNHHQRGMTE